MAIIDDKSKLEGLVLKYNDVLLESMKIALSEDLINLIIVNDEDNNFDLVNFIKNKKDFKNFVIKEFLKNNSKSPLKSLSKMDEILINLNKKYEKN